MFDRKFEKAVFIDRDGVINRELGRYTQELNEFEILPEVPEQLKRIWDKGYGLIVITNQGGIAKGLYSNADVEAMHQYFQGVCNLNGFAIDAFYYCPHHTDVTGKCLCRKPGSLMLEKAMHRFKLNPENCIMIGDNERDMKAASGANVKGVLIESNTNFWNNLIL